MTTKIYRETDANPSLLPLRKIAVVGYGNQGRSQALNLRDSDAQVIIGNIEDDYAKTAREDGFEVLAIDQAVIQSDVVMILLPDEIASTVFNDLIKPHLQTGDVVSFASGYNVAYGHVVCPEEVDLILLAPRMVGPGVRDRYLSKQGYYSFVAVEQDASGQALEVLLALCWGVGTLMKGAAEITFKMEAELDLFNEQAFGPAFGRVLLTAINTLIKEGYPRDVVLLEMYMSGELGYIFQTMAETGLINQLDDHSQTSQYGAISRGIKFLGVDIATPMKKILKNISSGNFAKEWTWERRTGKLRYRFLKFMALKQPINRMEKEVREHLDLKP